MFASGVYTTRPITCIVFLTAVQFTGRVYKNVHNTDCACGGCQQ